ncbi:MAG: tRNA (guanosine(37)-N1)-methyltransferase TrmD [Dehalococcoidia bacterium]|nr:tRNA (guanosine(37)-N1)-methyltransferase TrmD [Dehalococcoidia bacterium]MSQ17710.1 tRNA (guanosine(37)-N1)-methyltransferase TrmD [Dehalococcoidia bacterium]
MRFHILTLFPEAFKGPLEHSMLERARQHDLLSFQLTDIRDYAHDVHGTADDYQFGGGAGMVMKPEPVFEAVEAALAGYSPQERAAIPIVLTSPQGKLLDQQTAQALARCPALVLICGHYAGVDERVRQHLATHEISIGDYVLTGGELPAMVIMDTVARFVPGVVGSAENVLEDSITSGLLQHPLYTRPAQFRDLAVPDILLSGNHARIARWRREESLRRTLSQRPDLLAKAALPEEDLVYLNSLGQESPSAPLSQRGVGGISAPRLSRTDFRFHTQVRVRWNECDPQGIAFNGAFMNYLEVAHAEYFRNLGFSIYALARSGHFESAMVKVDLEFKAPARLDDLLELYLRVARVGRSSFTLELAIYGPPLGQSGDRLLAAGRAVYAGFDPASATARPVPDGIRELAEHFEATGEALPLARFPRLAEAAL